MSSPDTHTKTIAAFVADLSLDQVPAEVQVRTKYLILDAVGCGLAGARLPWSTTGVRALTELDDGDTGTVWGWDRRVTAPMAALLNGSFVQSFELDDYYEHGPLHSGSVVVPSVFATAESMQDVSGSDVLLGAVAGFEVGPRLGVGMDGYELLRRGWHCGAIYGVLASAVAASRLRGLTASETEDALGIAGTQASGLMAAQYEAMVKRMHHGFASRNGMVSAALAAHGYTGIKDVIERPYGGMAAVFNPDTVDMDRAVENLGTEWKLAGINIKPYAAMAGLHPAIDAAIDLRHQPGWSIDELSTVTIEMPLVPFKHGGWTLERPATEIGAQMNVAYAFAAAYMDGNVLTPQYRQDRLGSDVLWSLIDRIEVRHSEQMDQLAAETGKKRVTRVTCSSRSGEVEERTILEAKGQGSKLLTNDEIEIKFRSLVADIMPATRVDAIVSAVLGIEERFTELGGLLAEEVTSPF